MLANLLIFLAYMLIPYLLWRASRKQHTPLPVNTMFATFIFSCGTGHLMYILLIWVPVYWWGAIVDCLTAIASVGCTIHLIRRGGGYIKFLDAVHEHQQLEDRVSEMERQLGTGV